nr:3-[(3aS,4S,7aS)-7a-methyl-1,5-dioxo-octahydro-1H-inden-4-yl]propanoyl:CoA ligase-like [Nerophis lumbriciformis]
MQTTPQTLIDTYTRNGWWGQDTASSLLQQAIAEQPERLALVDAPNRQELVAGEAARLTYSDLCQRVDKVGAAFHANGVRADDIVVVQLPNIVELPIVFLALARLGAVVSPVPVQYGGHELGKIRKALDASAFVSARRFKSQNLLAEHASAFDGCMLFATASESNDEADDSEISSAVDLDRYELNADAQSAYDGYCASFEPQANDIFTVCWTSGTTGVPKGVPRSYNHWMATSVGSGDLAELQDADVLLNPFPLVNMGGIGGFFFNWLKCHGTLVLHHPMDLPVFLGQIAAEKTNYTIAPPALLNMLLQNKQLLENLDLTALRSIGSGSAPLSPWMVEGYETDYGISIMNNFGSNEGMCLLCGPKEVPDPALRGELFPRFGAGDYQWTNRMASMFSTKLIDTESGEEINEPEVQGEMLIKGPTVFDGYWNSPEVNAEVFSDDGYFHTGDLFEIAKEGGVGQYYRFVGRHKDIISRGGMKISPAELDNLLAGHEKIADVAVVGVPDDILGERVAVAVVPKAGEVVDLSDIIDFLRTEDIAKFKRPELLQVVETLPRNPLGKVLRHELVHIFADDSGG